MQSPLKLFMLLLGCKPKGRFTEQHDIFFDIGSDIGSLKQHLLEFWPEADGKLHIDAWREVSLVDSYQVEVVPRVLRSEPSPPPQLFFINLGGYKPGEFEEYHYKMLVAAPDKGSAINQAKLTAFYQHTGFKGAESHIDDKYGVDVDDFYKIEDVLPGNLKEKYSIRLQPGGAGPADPLQLGYLMLDKWH
jgi:hypothetical protein